jgi:hypothetical protein
MKRKPKWRVVTCRYSNCSDLGQHVIIYQDGYVAEFKPTIREAWAWIADHTNGSQA